MKLLREGLNVVESIPPTFWGVVFGSFFSLGGVVLSNRSSERRMRAQFVHDRELRTKERDLSLRKEIYLSAAEALHAGYLIITAFLNADISYEKLTEPYLEKAPAIAKVQIIANDKTMQAVVAVTGALADAILQLSAKRVPLVRLKQEIAQVDQLIASFAMVRDQMLEAMKQHNIDGSTDQRRFSVLQGNFEFEQNRVKEGIENRTKLQSEFTRRQLELAEECFAASSEIGELVVPVVVAVREELEMPLDAAAYAKLIQAQQKKQSENIAQFISQIRASISTGAVGS